MNIPLTRPRIACKPIMRRTIQTHGSYRTRPCGAFWAGQEAEKETGIGSGMGNGVAVGAGLETGGGRPKVRKPFSVN